MKAEPTARPTLREELLSPELSGSVGFLLAKAAELVTADFEHALHPFGIRARDYGVLSLLHRRGALSQQQIGEAVRIDRTTMVSIIDDLEGAGLVERTRDPKDRRRYAVTLTGKGEKLFAGALTQANAKVHEEFLAALSPAERDSLVDMLVRLTVEDR
ncbi:MarR family winged helix-turn-helix transcriptional regulator [Actinomadura macrotermitis]|uniref:Transcriptional regulator SlyA n=1 Tax=Actinomadura macrotermitis TaxID=2585200 RepID=A0A7K0C239_9ACTN|nr:MarR family transcriptional regulator [Actinomadura macrotermitis]MQY07535.1 Transcriptional regulator SlyA [Actinomadura macrotermitis]